MYSERFQSPEQKEVRPDEQMYNKIKSGEMSLEEFSAYMQKQRERLIAAEALATKDPLTGADNRKGFNDRLREAVNRAKRTGGPFSLIACDIDHFKDTNNTLPRKHLDGDEVLKIYAKVAKKCTRRTDTVARPGGDEFAFILETDEQHALLVAERIRVEVIAAVKKKFPDFREQTSSMGITQYRNGDAPMDMALRVEHALHEAKIKGRNQIVIYQDKE